MKPGPQCYELKARVLAGEITVDQAVAEMTKPQTVLDCQAGANPEADPEPEAEGA